jgi:hypothetical protein
MKPSSDIDLFTTTLPFPVLVFRTVLLQKTFAGVTRAASQDVTRARNLIASPAIKPTADDGDDREARLDAVRPFLDPDFIGVSRVYLGVFSSKAACRSWTNCSSPGTPWTSTTRTYLRNL